MNKKIKAGIAGLAAVAVIGGTFAYFSATTSIKNPFNTKEYGSTTVEKFNPEDGKDWEPGATVDKETFAKNTGDYPVYARVKLDEVWSRNGAEFKIVDAAYTVKQESHDDGLTENDDSVVTKNLGKDWVLGSDGYYYYKEALEAGKTSTQFLKSVTLISDVDMGKYGNSEVYVITPDTIKTEEQLNEYMKTHEWTAVPDAGIASVEVGSGKTMWRKDASELNKGLAGYAGANYELTVTTDFIQADAETVAAAGWSIPAGVTLSGK